MKVAVLGAAGGIGQALLYYLKHNCLQVQNSRCTILLL
jgi:malate/lactate dehydrogenase